MNNIKTDKLKKGLSVYICTLINGIIKPIKVGVDCTETIDDDVKYNTYDKDGKFHRCDYRHVFTNEKSALKYCIDELEKQIEYLDIYKRNYEKRLEVIENEENDKRET